MKGSSNVKGVKLALIVTVVCLAGVLFSSSAFAKGDEILIGAAVSMTGPLAPDGLEQKWAYEQAVDDWNKKGGIYIKEAGKKLPIRIVFADDESDTARVAAAMEKLIKIDKVDLMLSTHSASLMVAAVNAAEKYKMYYHVTTHWPEMWSPQK